MRVADSEISVSFILKALSVGLMVGLSNHFLFIGISTSDPFMIIMSLLGILAGVSYAIYLRREM